MDLKLFTENGNGVTTDAYKEVNSLLEMLNDNVWLTVYDKQTKAYVTIRSSAVIAIRS